jgi:hypothetical protein
MNNGIISTQAVFRADLLLILGPPYYFLKEPNQRGRFVGCMLIQQYWCVLHSESVFSITLSHDFAYFLVNDALMVADHGQNISMTTIW